MEYKQICQIILNVTIMSTFIGIFFFTYAASVEQDIVKEQSEYIAETMANKIKFLLPQDVKNELSQLEAPDMTKADADVKKSNTELRNKAMIVLGVVFVTGIIATLIVAKIGNVGFHIVKESIIILLFVAITEFTFLNIVTKQYKVADPNFVTGEVLKSIRNVYPPI